MVRNEFFVSNKMNLCDVIEKQLEKDEEKISYILLKNDKPENNFSETALKNMAEEYGFAAGSYRFIGDVRKNTTMAETVSGLTESVLRCGMEQKPLSLIVDYDHEATADVLGILLNAVPNMRKMSDGSIHNIRFVFETDRDTDHALTYLTFSLGMICNTDNCFFTLSLRPEELEVLMNGLGCLEPLFIDMYNLSDDEKLRLQTYMVEKDILDQGDISFAFTNEIPGCRIVSEEDCEDDVEEMEFDLEDDPEEDYVPLEDALKDIEKSRKKKMVKHGLILAAGCLTAGVAIHMLLKNKKKEVPVPVSCREWARLRELLRR